MKFHCDKCGECCRNLDKSDLYNNLHAGDGVCKYLKGNLCSIYNERPLVCRVEDCYKYFEEELDYDEYLQLNMQSCELIKKYKEGF